MNTFIHNTPTCFVTNREFSTTSHLTHTTRSTQPRTQLQTKGLASPSNEQFHVWALDLT